MGVLADVIRTYLWDKFDERARERGLKEPHVYCGDYFDIERKCAVSRYNKNCMVLYMNPEPALADVIKQEYGSIKDAELSICCGRQASPLNRVPTDIMLLTKKDLIEYVNKNYSDYYAFELKFMLDDEFKQKALDEQKLKGNMFISCLGTYQLYNDVDRECELVHLLKTFLYDNNDIGTVVKYYHEDHKEDFPENLLERGVFKDNRLYLPWDDTMCIVLSKNPYDYIWASTGNGYQSCFSLESDYWGIQAMPMLATQPWHFMMYWSKCTLSEYSIMNHKFKLPNIQMRNWAYRSGDKLAIDKFYGKCGNVMHYRQFLDLMYPEFSKNRCTIDMDVDGFKDIVEKYRTYLDSLRLDGEFIFGDGMRGFTVKLDSMYEIKESVSHIYYNPDLRWKEGSIGIMKNKFCYINVCPKTKLLTEETEHWAAKYIDRPVRSMAIFGYQVDSQRNELSLIEASNRSVNAEYAYWYGDDYVYKDDDSENLNTLKYALTECQTEHPQVDCILLRIVDKNKVTFQPFYAKKEPKYK